MTPTRIEPLVLEPLVIEEALDAGEADAGLAEAIPVSVAAVHPPAYRNARYLARCRRESRREAPVVEAIFSKSEARTRARALARAGQFDEVLLLSRMAYGETGTPRAGYNDDPSTPLWDEVEAFLAVLDGRRGRMSRAEMFVAYSPRRVFPRGGHERNSWIAELQLDGARPPSWPRNARERRGIRNGYPGWRTYGCPRWLATVDAVRRVLEAHPERITSGPCEEQPDHWGGRDGVDDHAVELGWRLINCGTTRNRFWIVPTDERGVEEESLPQAAPVLEQAADDDATDELREADLPTRQGVLG